MTRELLRRATKHYASQSRMLLREASVSWRPLSLSLSLYNQTTNRPTDSKHRNASWEIHPSSKGEQHQQQQQQYQQSSRGGGGLFRNSKKNNNKESSFVVCCSMH
mmetsp:Transcript_36930/g.55005  ORF Transcript_36930/g.55005 Transcript_36930/m.55005 type:complete len:105 (-) Transcript_36930:344-658(-)